MRMIIDLRNKMELIVAFKKIVIFPQGALINNRTISVWLNFKIIIKQKE